MLRKLRPSCEPWIIDGEGVVYLDGACPVDGQQTPDSKEEGPEGSLKQLKRRLTASGLFLLFTCHTLLLSLNRPGDYLVRIWRSSLLVRFLVFHYTLELSLQSLKSSCFNMEFYPTLNI